MPRRAGPSEAAIAAQARARAAAQPARLPDDEARALEAEMAAVAPQPVPDMRKKRSKTAGPADSDTPEPRAKRASMTQLDVAPWPRESPIAILGFNQQKFHFLDVMGQHIALGSKFEAGEITALFGGEIGFLDQHYPQWTKGDPPTLSGFNQVKVRRAIIAAAQLRGFFNPEGRIHGIGAHPGEDGALILHCGDTLWVAGAKGFDPGSVQAPYAARPGRVGRLLFPLGDSIDPPSPPGQAANRAECWRLMIEVFGSWRFKTTQTIEIEGEDVNISAWMIFCWTMMAKVCGAVTARASLWITGPSGAGKSELQKAMKRAIGDGWLLDADNMTEAWVTQKLQQDRLAVLYDEAEESEQNEAYMANILTLAKLAFDGKKKGRGSSDGKPVTTMIYTAMQFGSVNIPELKPEQRNRMCIIEIERFPAGTPVYEPSRLLDGIAPRLQRRILEQWPRMKDMQARYAREMAVHGWTGREQSAYCPMLAAGDLLLFDGNPQPGDDRVKTIVRAIQPLRDSSRSNVEDHPQLAAHHLASTLLPSQGGKAAETVAQWIIRAATEFLTNAAAFNPKTVSRVLESHGMRLVNLTDDHDKGTGQGGIVDLKQLRDENGNGLGMVAVAGPANQGMKAIFKASDMFRNGKWMQALSRLEHACTDADGNPDGRVRKSIVNKRTRLGGSKSFAVVLVPIEALIDMEELDAAIAQERLNRQNAVGGGR
jgi:hypothetical protein